MRYCQCGPFFSLYKQAPETESGKKYYMAQSYGSELCGGRFVLPIMNVAWNGWFEGQIWIYVPKINFESFRFDLLKGSRVKNISKVAAYIETVFYLKVHTQLFIHHHLHLFWEQTRRLSALSSRILMIIATFRHCSSPVHHYGLQCIFWKHRILFFWRAQEIFLILFPYLGSQLSL